MSGKAKMLSYEENMYIICRKIEMFLRRNMVVRREMEGRAMKMLEGYGFGESEISVYLCLVRQGREMSVVEMARKLKVGRTPVYNALEKLEAKGVVGRTIGENGYSYLVTEDGLEQYWRGKMRRVKRLTEQFPELVNMIEGMKMVTGYKSRVEYYTGKQGLKQITYNSLKANGDLYIYEMLETMDDFVDKESAEEFRRRWVERGVKIHQLTNVRSFGEFTEVEEITGELWDVRYIAPEVLAIKFEMVIYNDVCALYSREGRELFGVEIYNPNLAEMQKQIFRAMERLAKSLTKVGQKGEARVTT